MTLDQLLEDQAIAESLAIGNDAAVLAWLNTPSVLSIRKVPIDEFVACLYDSGAFLSVYQAAATGNATAQLGIGVLKEAKGLGLANIDLSLETNQSLLSGLVASGAITQAQADAAASLKNCLVSPAEAAGLGYIQPQELAEWRASHG